DGDGGVPDLARLLAVGLAAVVAEDVPRDHQARAVGRPQPLPAAASHHAAPERAVLRAPLDGHAARAGGADDVVGRDAGLAGLDEVAAHLGGVDLVVNKLAAAAAVEVGAVRAGPVQAAAADDEVLDVVEGDEPLVLAGAALLRAGPVAEVVA